MSTLKQIKDRISSIEKIIKITQAMEVVSLFRLKKIEKKTQSRKDYFAQFKKIVADLYAYVNYVPHSFFALKKIQKPLVLCIGSDKGLCGGFNLFVIKQLAEFKRNYDAKIVVSGRRLHILKNLYASDILEFNDLEKTDIKHLAEFIFSQLKEKKFDSFFIIHNQFRMNLLGKAQSLQVLPLKAERKKDLDFIWEAENLWDDFFSSYIKEALESSFLESRASEEFTRVFTMKQAKDNARDLKEKIYLDFHKLRQRLITRELTNLSSMLVRR